MLSSKKARELRERVEEYRRKGENREIVTAVYPNDLPMTLVGDYLRYYAAWAHHQLGEYDEALILFSALKSRYPSGTEIGGGARRGRIHAFLQKGNLKAALEEVPGVPPSKEKDNVFANLLLVLAKNKERIPVDEALDLIQRNSLAPYDSTQAHIVNNSTFALFEARVLQPEVDVTQLTTYIDGATGMYKTVQAAKNHIGGSLYRAALIYEAVDLREALDRAEESIDIWTELVNSQGGERYAKNLQGVIDLRDRIRNKINAGI